MTQDCIYSDEELRQIQKLEHKTLLILLDICEKLELSCFLIGGSALGAVRHQGFIPWDDDIDVGMLREDYRRFLTEAPTLLPKGYSLQTPEGGAENPYPYAKIRVDGTRFVEYCNHRNRKMHHGVYVDLFPFDEVPDDETENLRQFRRVQRLNRLFTVRHSADLSRPPIGVTGKLKAALRLGCYGAAKCLIPRKLLLSKLEKTCNAWNGTGQSAVACLNFPKRKCEYIRKNDLFPLGRALFEGTEAPIPGNYDVYLKTHYGDYMELPPEDQRYGHRPFEISLGDFPQ